MIEVKKKLFPVSIIVAGMGAFAISIFNRNKLKNLEDEIKSTRDDVKSILCYQEQKNAFIESELEEMRNEVASCYEHFEAFSNGKKDGR
ncbi:TPA: hypothetical protein PPO51_003797 [Clostridioides difficile]|nr:hypothetical protein [Clostridioides difficile]HDJ1472221.1 hypothetical protein [Clostridioides difficile]